MHRLTMQRLILQCLLGISVWFFQTNVSAQDASNPPASPGQTTIIQRVPDAFVLFNPESGFTIKLPGPWSFIDIDDFLQFTQREQKNPVPSFIISNISATGTVVGNLVETRIQIELATTGYRPVRIPLGFKEGILPSEEQIGQPPFRYTGAGSVDLTVDIQERQYVALITPQSQQATESAQSEGSVGAATSEKPETAQRYTLSLVLWFPLTQNGVVENKLVISFPQSNSSQFFLEVPMNTITASVTRGFLLGAQENVAKQSTLLQIQGLRPDTEITWGKKKVEIVVDRPVLSVAGATIEARLDAGFTIYDAVLPVSSETGTFDHLQIRLPRDCSLDREFTSQYAAGGGYSVGDVDENFVVTIRFPQKTAGPVSLHLRAVQQFEDTSDFKRELTGFEVLGAERQAGFLTVSVSPSVMNPHWELVRGIRRTEDGARFEFISQPFLLRVQAIAPQTRINVKPEYQFRISKGSIQMIAHLSYMVSGSKAETLYLRLPDTQWHCEFGTSSNVNVMGVAWDSSGLLNIPLRTSTDGPFDIDFRASRMISTEEEQTHRIVLPIPSPQQTTWTEPAKVTIVSENNVEVVPIEESASTAAEQRILGLTRQTRRTAMPQIPINLTDLQQEPLFYRTDTGDAVFVADLIFHQKEIKATMQTSVGLFEEYYQVTQTVTYNATYASEDRLHFLVPKLLEMNGDIQVMLDNRMLELRDTTLDGQENVPDGWVRKLVQLPEPKFQFELTFRYSVPPFAVVGDEAVLFTLNFICPLDVPASNHRIFFLLPSGYKAELQPESRQFWESFRPPPRSPSIVAEAFRSAQSPNRIALLVSAPDRNVSGTTIVERAWLQTWLTGSMRYDRATYRLRSTNNSVAIQLPLDSIREHRVLIQIDGRPIQPDISPTAVLTLPILPEWYNRSVEVSIDYRYSFDMPGIEVPIILPSFEKNTLVQQTYWQVILQQSQHIIGCPEGWTLEYGWAWNGLFWWRIPSIRKSDIGLSSDETDSESVASVPSQYVFRHLQPPSRVTLYIVSRSWIVLCSSSIALFIGLMLIYVPQSRYAGSLLGLGIALLAALFYQPPSMLLMLQAATFGVFLALGTGYLYRIFHRQRQWVPSAFPLFDEMSQPYITPQPQRPLVHEVIMDEGSTGKDSESAVANNGPS